MVSKPNPKRVRVGKEGSDKLDGKPIDIVVGNEKKVYSVHEALLRASSPFFDKAMAGKWNESAQITVQLPDDEPKIVALYVHWLYYGTLPVLSDEPGTAVVEEYSKLIKAYVLGDKLLDAAFQNSTIDAIIEKSRTSTQDGKNYYPSVDNVNYVYKSTRASAPIRRLLVDMYAIHGGSSWLDHWRDPGTIPQPFLLGMVLKLFDRVKNPKTSIEARNYHIHGNGQGSTSNC